MARGVNKVIIVGNLGNDPEVRYMPSGGAVANLSVATSESWKDKSSGERQERTEWHRISMFGRLGEIAGEYLRKGSKVYIEGSLRTRKWQGQDGSDRYTTEIIANEMQMLDARGGEFDGAPGGGGGGGSRQAPPNQGGYNQQGGGGGGGYQNSPPPQQGGGNRGGNTPPPPPAPEEFDDDIPF